MRETHCGQNWALELGSPWHSLGAEEIELERERNESNLRSETEPRGSWNANQVCVPDGFPILDSPEVLPAAPYLYSKPSLLLKRVVFLLQQTPTNPGSIWIQLSIPWVDFCQKSRGVKIQIIPSSWCQCLWRLWWKWRLILCDWWMRNYSPPLIWTLAILGKQLCQLWEWLLQEACVV